MSRIELDSITKVFPNGVRAVDGVALDIADGEFMVLVGPSGCGKSTLLRMIAGLEECTEGGILIGDLDVTSVAPQQRDIAMVFQDYALYPHMTVGENLAYGLKLKKMPKAEWQRRVNEVAKTLGLDELLDRKPAKLSGGQRQRVAMGRAIVREPKAFLMDEPLSNLDAKLRVSMRAELAKLHERLGVTTVYVTHDQVEAMTLGQRVAVLRDGVLQQVDTPTNIYNKPANTFVASFIGSPSMNLYRGRLEANGAGGKLSLGRSILAVPPSVFAEHPGLAGGSGEIIAGIRPEDMEDAALSPSHPVDQRLTAPVVLTESLGSDQMVHFTVDAPVAKVADRDSLDEIQVAGGTGVCIGRFNARSQVRAGETIEVAVDCSRLHFFDAGTGLVI